MFVVSAVIGWVAFAAILLAALIGWKPHLAARIRRFAAHQAVGIAIVPLSLAHLAAAAFHIETANVTGLYVAAAALCVALLQIVLGLGFETATGRNRVALRRWHRGTFVLLFALAAVHIALNGPFAPLKTPVRTAPEGY